MNAFMVGALMLDRRPAHAPLTAYPALSILIAAYKEEDSIVGTLESIARQGYPGRLQVTSSMTARPTGPPAWCAPRRPATRGWN
jgi:cellulose synthase/poly-beta-1,6-N-acetylglucosamine synthase-like glycosyltransferase